jgi:plastocyanin
MGAFKFTPTPEVISEIINTWSDNGLLDLTLKRIGKNKFKPTLTTNGKLVMEMDSIYLNPGDTVTFQDVRYTFDITEN